MTHVDGDLYRPDLDPGVQMIGICAFTRGGGFIGRVAHRATFKDVSDAQCCASGWEHRWPLTDYRAVEFDPEGNIATVYPPKRCPNR